MASWIKFLLKSSFFMFVICHAYSEDSPSSATNAELTSNPQPSSDRYNKRPSSAGHSFVRFGRPDASNKGHSFLYFGKRTTPEESHIAELLQYLQRTQEPSWKRGHSIMRFGKRTSDKHNILRFGKRDESEEGGDSLGGDLEDLTPEELKRGGHSMMYFGKRGGHSMMYFGKRDPSEAEEKRAGHSMMYFGKRAPDDSPKKTGHSMLYFGKRELDDNDKRAGHSMMYFGKRGGHSMMYFGKRASSEEDSQDDSLGSKRSPHSMIHFGKKSDGSQKSHSMLRFGKRSEDMTDDDSLEDMEKKAGHNMIHFGKREAGIMGKGYPMWMPSSGPFESLRGSYYTLGMNSGGSKMSKKPHNMMHFGKRSVEETSKSVKENHEEDHKADSGKELPEKSGLSRKKRDTLSSETPVIGFAPFVPNYSAMYDYIDDNAESSESYDDSKIVPERNVRSDGEPGKSKNVFLRFG